VRQVGYLPELYEDARSEKYLKNKKKTHFMFNNLFFRKSYCLGDNME